MSKETFNVLTGTSDNPRSLLPLYYQVARMQQAQMEANSLLQQREATAFEQGFDSPRFFVKKVGSDHPGKFFQSIPEFKKDIDLPQSSTILTADTPTGNVITPVRRGTRMVETEFFLRRSKAADRNSQFTTEAEEGKPSGFFAKKVRR